MRDLGHAGVLEVAFGGGEPWTFPDFVGLVRRLHEETSVAVSMTTNGIMLTRERFEAIEGYYGQIRISLYDDNDWRRSVTLLARAGARFGVNYLVTPRRLADLETRILEIVGLGCRDVLLLCYKGFDSELHLSTQDAQHLALRVATLGRALEGRAVIKLDVCWGERMEAVPRFAADGRRSGDCGAGRNFVVMTGDRRLQPCSFHDFSVPITCATDVLEVWRGRARNLAAPTTWPGCARVPGYGIGPTRRLEMFEEHER